MEKEYIKIYEYKVPEDIIKNCIEEERNVTSKDIEMEIQQELKKRNIEYKNKVYEKLKRRYRYFTEYEYINGIYVQKGDIGIAKQIVTDYEKSIPKETIETKEKLKKQSEKKQRKMLIIITLIFVALMIITVLLIELSKFIEN